MAKGFILIVAMLFLPALAMADTTQGSFTYQNGVLTTLNVPSEDPPVGIDNFGDVVFGQAVLYNNQPGGQYLQLGSAAIVKAVSEDGTRLSSGAGQYFTHTRFGTGVPVNAPGFLNGLNDNGQFVGTSFDGQTNFIYDSKTGAITNVANSAYLVTINDQGTVLGWSAGPVRNSFLYNAGVFTTLALPTGCVATGMNDNGTVVGDCLNGSGFVDQSGTISYLDYTAPNNGDKYDTFLSGINDSGEIVGSFTNVPEPGSLLLLGAGITALALAISLKNRLA